MKLYIAINIGGDDFELYLNDSSIIMFGNETRKCANVTIIDDQTVEKEESFEVTITFLLSPEANDSGDIVPTSNPIKAKIYIIDDDGEHDEIKTFTEMLYHMHFDYLTEYRLQIFSNDGTFACRYIRYGV